MANSITINKNKKDMNRSMIEKKYIDEASIKITNGVPFDAKKFKNEQEFVKSLGIRDFLRYKSGSDNLKAKSLIKQNEKNTKLNLSTIPMGVQIEKIKNNHRKFIKNITKIKNAEIVKSKNKNNSNGKIMGILFTQNFKLPKEINYAFKNLLKKKNEENLNNSLIEEDLEFLIEDEQGNIFTKNEKENQIMNDIFNEEDLKFIKNKSHNRKKKRFSGKAFDLMESFDKKNENNTKENRKLTFSNVLGKNVNASNTEISIKTNNDFPIEDSSSNFLLNISDLNKTKSLIKNNAYNENPSYLSKFMVGEKKPKQILDDNLSNNKTDVFSNYSRNQIDIEKAKNNNINTNTIRPMQPKGDYASKIQFDKESVNMLNSNDLISNSNLNLNLPTPTEKDEDKKNPFNLNMQNQVFESRKNSAPIYTTGN